MKLVRNFKNWNLCGFKSYDVDIDLPFDFANAVSEVFLFIHDSFILFVPGDFYWKNL